MMSSRGANFECCMCGDSGLSYELFRCKVCQFRSQHRLKKLKPKSRRYCSNLYPKAESYRVCNWCLIQKDGNTAILSADQDPKSTKKKYSVGVGMYHQHRIATKSSQPASPVKKQRPTTAEGASPSPSPSPTGKKRLVTGVEDQEQELANGSVTPVPRHVFRNKVRRYKLLEEVSS